MAGLPQMGEGKITLGDAAAHDSRRPAALVGFRWDTSGPGLVRRYGGSGHDDLTTSIHLDDAASPGIPAARWTRRAEYLANEPHKDQKAVSGGGIIRRSPARRSMAAS